MEKLFKNLDDLIFAYEQGIISYELYLNEKHRIMSESDKEESEERSTGEWML